MKKSDKIKTLTIINTGILRNSKYLLNIKAYSDYSLPVFTYLIQHENIWVLFDTGLSCLLAKDPENYLGFILDSIVPFRTQKDWVVSEQLPINTNQLSTIILSHRHFDHTGEVVSFPNTTIFIHEKEMKSSNTILGSLKGIKNVDIPDNANIVYPSFENIKNPWGLKLLYDLLADRSIFIAFTPGHVKGHISVVLNTNPPIFLAGDALYTPPSSYTHPNIKKYWDMLSTIYYFKNKGLLFTSHDKIQKSTLLPYPWIIVKDSPNNAYLSPDAVLDSEESII